MKTLIVLIFLSIAAIGTAQTVPDSADMKKYVAIREKVSVDMKADELKKADVFKYLGMIDLLNYLIGIEDKKFKDFYKVK
jgi:hypothetical protein